MRRALGRLSCLVLLLALAGCHKLNYEKTDALDVEEIKTYTIDARKADQKVRVVASSSDCPVSVYLVLQKDVEAMEGPIAGGQAPDKEKVLAGQAKVKEATLEATVPGNNEFTVIVGGATKKTTITVKVTEI